jgi:DNA polymerase-3 subunit delta'
MAFESVIGHERQKDILLAYLETKNLPHAFLFSGQEGIGKCRMAMEFIKVLLCLEGTGCGKCRSCVRIEHENHPDVRRFGGDGTITIDQARSITEETLESPYEGGRRAIVIDRADRMTTEAANALLKTLEEPPPFNLFILVTPSERNLPLTVRSRCIRVTFNPLRMEHLKRYFLEKAGTDDDRASLLSHISYGSIACGLFWMEREKFVLRKELAELIVGKNRSHLSATFVAEKVTEEVKEIPFFLSFVLSFLRDLYVFQEQRDVSIIVNRDVRELLEWEMIDLSWIEDAMFKVEDAVRLMRYNVNRWLVFENLLLQIMR